MAFGPVQFPTGSPRAYQAGQQQQAAAPQEEDSGGGLLGSLFGMGLNALGATMGVPGLGTLAGGLIGGNPQQAISGVAQMAGLGGAAGMDAGSPAPTNQGSSAVSGAVNKAADSNSSEGESTGSDLHEMGHPQKIEDPKKEQEASPQQDPSSQLQQLLAMMYLSQMFQGMNPSMFQMPHNPVTGMNPAARSPITGGVVGA